MSTPANIRAIRMRIGLTISEASELFGIPIRDVEQCERSNSFIIPGGYMDELRAVESAMLEYFYDDPIGDDPPVLIGYRNIEMLLYYEPHAAPLRSNSVHRMALAQRQREIFTAMFRSVPIVELREPAYERWRLERGLPESMETRIQWALEYMQRFRVNNGGY